MSGPLEGVRILAISQFGAGPYGTQALSDLGAEVIKIEDPLSGGDVARYVPPFEIDGDSLYFQSFNRGKKSVAINLRDPSGFDVFRDLVRCQTPSTTICGETCRRSSVSTTTGSAT